MADCSTYCAPYARTSQDEYGRMASYWLLKSVYDPEKDRIKVIGGKSTFPVSPYDFPVINKDLSFITDDLVLDLQGEVLHVKRNFQILASLIEQSKAILALEPAWDEENAMSIDLGLWKAAIKFLVQCASDIYENHDRIIEIPEINPCKDGTVDLSWRTSRVRLLINFRHSTEGVRAYYYGDFYQSEQPIKGWINADSTDNFLSMWMKNLAE